MAGRARVMDDEPGPPRRSVGLWVVSDKEDKKMTRPTYLTLKVLAIAIALALTACVLALMATQKPAGAAFPGENGRIAFVGTPNGVGPDAEIYTMLPDGSNQRQLTSTTYGARSPAWSADGTKIAFTVYEGSTEIYTMNSDGSGLEQLTPTDGLASADPAWSPDGTKIAFWSYHVEANGYYNRDIYVMNADGSGVSRLTTDLNLDMAPVWSPDGTKIVFVGDYGSSPNTELYTVDASGSPPSALTNTPEVQEFDPVWSPDGAEIMFGAYEFPNFPIGSVTGIWRMRADGTNRININPSSHVGDTDWQPKLPDTTPPSVTSTVPKADATEVAPTANVRATFSEEMDSNTIDDTTFQLFKRGTTTQIAAQVSYNADTDTAKLDPTDNLKRGV